MLACPRYELHLHFITLFSGIFGLYECELMFLIDVNELYRLQGRF